MQQFLSKTMPVSVSRKMLEEINNSYNNHHNSNSDRNRNRNSADSSNSMFSTFSSSYSSSRSISPEPTFDPVLSGHSLHRQPTFSYIPIHKRRRSGTPTLIHSISFNSLSTSVPNNSSPLLSTSLQTPDSEVPSTPTSMFSSHSDSTEYTSFPNLEKFTDECWTEVHVEERKDCVGDLEMESYDEMVVAGVRFLYY